MCIDKIVKNDCVVKKKYYIGCAKIKQKIALQKQTDRLHKPRQTHEQHIIKHAIITMRSDRQK